MPARQTVARTIRLEPFIDNVLKQEADQAGLTHTAITTRALRKYVSFDRFADKTGSLTISKETLSRILAFLSDEEAEVVGSLANFAGKNARQYMNLLIGSSSMEDMFTLLQILSTYAHLFEFEQQVAGNKHHLIFAHNMGSKWSSFLQGAIQATFREGFGIRARFEKTESLVSCTFEYRG
jgi:hypothetical protein